MALRTSNASTASYLPTQAARSNQRPPIVAGSLLSLIATCVRVGLSLVSVPLTLGYVGTERYGGWMVAVSAVAILSLIDAGVSPALKNRMAEALASGDRENFQKYVGATVLFGTGAALLGALVVPILGFVNWAPIYGVVGGAFAVEAGPLTQAVVATSFANLALAGVEAVLSAQLRLSRVYLAHIVSAVVAFGLTIVAIQVGSSLPVVAACVGGSPALARLMLIAGFMRGNGEITRRQVLSSLSSLRGVLPTSAGFIAIQLGNVVVSASPSLLAAHALGVGEVARFSIAHRLASVPLLAVAAVVPVWWPAFTRAWAVGNYSWVRKRLVYMGGATAVSLAVYGAMLVFTGSTIVRLWLNDAVEVDGAVLGILGIWAVLQSVSHWATTFLNSIGDLRPQMWSVMAQAGLLCVTLPSFAQRFGLPGVVAAMSLSLGVAAVIPIVLRARSRLRIAEAGTK